MRLTRKDLNILIERFLKEAPLATGDDDQPSIIVPGSEEEREEFKKRSGEVDGDNPVLDPEKIMGLSIGARRSYDIDSIMFGSRNPPEDIDPAFVKQVNEYLSEEYKKLYLSSGNVKRVTRQLSNFPLDIHFVLLPQFVGVDSYSSDISQFFNDFRVNSKEFGREMRLGGRSANVGDERKVVKDLNSLGVFSNNINDAVEISHKSRQKIFSVDDPKMGPYNEFIKDFIQEKTGAVVKPDDLVIVNFVTFRNIGKVLDYRDFEAAKTYIDSILRKRFYFQDSIYMIMHTFFDGGPMGIPAGVHEYYDEGDERGLGKEGVVFDQIVFYELCQRLKKYDPFFNFSFDDYDEHRKFTRENPPEYASVEDIERLKVLARQYDGKMVHNPTRNSWYFKSNDGRPDSERPELPDEFEPIYMIRSSNKKRTITTGLDDEIGYSFTTTRKKKPDTIGTILGKDSEQGVRNIFKPKTIKSGTVNTPFDFYAELCNFSFLQQRFPIDIQKIENSDVLSEDDKDYLLNEFVPYYQGIHQEVLDFTQSLKGTFVYGSASDITRDIK